MGAIFSLSVTQLILAFFAAKVVREFVEKLLFLNWMASYRFKALLVPSNDELRTTRSKVQQQHHSGTPGKGGKGKGKHKPSSSPLTPAQQIEADKKEQFKIYAHDLDVVKIREKVMEGSELAVLTLGQELEWVMDLAIMSAFSFVITETQFYIYNNTRDLNFSLVWGFIMVTFCVKILGELTLVYFKNYQGSGERNICIVSLFFFFLIALIFIMANEDYIEFELTKAYNSFNESTSAYLNGHDITTTTSTTTSTTTKAPVGLHQHAKLGHMTFLVAKVVMVLLSAIIGVMFTFPGLRFGQIHRSLMERTGVSSLTKFLCTLNFITPAIIVMLWIKPIARDIATTQPFFPMDDSTFDTLRIYAVVLINLFRLYMTPIYVGGFLASAKDRIMRFKHRGGGWTTNHEIQANIATIYNFVNVVAVQYSLPILMCAFTAFTYGTMGGYNWLPTKLDAMIDPDKYTTTTMAPITTTTLDPDFSEFDAVSESTVTTVAPIVIKKVVEQSTFLFFSVEMGEIRRIFAPQVFRGILGYAVWWLHFVWFSTSSLGILYYTFLRH